MKALNEEDDMQKQVFSWGNTEFSSGNTENFIG